MLCVRKRGELSSTLERKESREKDLFLLSIYYMPVRQELQIRYFIKSHNSTRDIWLEIEISLVIEIKIQVKMSLCFESAEGGSCFFRMA